MSRLRAENLVYRPEQKGPFSFIIEASSCLGLTGPSGSGKTLLLRALADLDPYKGLVFLDDSECSSLPAPAWRRQVGMLPAESQWWQPSVGEHVEDLDENLLLRIGFDRDVLGWSISRLSSGEKQRLALVRLLANKPRALLLDEPTKSLDSENVQKMESLVADYREKTGCSVLWVTHDEEQASRLGQTRFHLKAGNLVEIERSDR